MELLSPAGNIEKLYYAYKYGADAAYIGLRGFSLRAKADNFIEDDYKKIKAIKDEFPGRRLHCALNISFHNNEVASFLERINDYKLFPIDAFIVQDMGLVPILQKEFPNAELHLSTQASCMNYLAAKAYRDMGFKRVVLGREVSLKEVSEIKEKVDNLEIECFVHGAMCVAYSGRCLLSAYMNGRSGQSGLCTHTCRWNYALKGDVKQLAQSGGLVLEEESRPNEYFPVFEGDNFTAILSSKDLCMIDHLEDMKKAGVDSLKIEGRMKSIYYVALVSRAYRKALDVMDGKITAEEAKPYIDELYLTSHREFTTGFFYGRADADKAVMAAAECPYLLSGTVGEELSESEADEIFERGKKSFASLNESFTSEVEKAQDARREQWLKNPDWCVPCAHKKDGWKLYRFHPLNHISCKVGAEEQSKDEIGRGYDVAYEAQRKNAKEGDKLEFVGSSFLCKKATDSEFQLVSPKNGMLVNWVSESHECLLYTPHDLERGTIVRIRDYLRKIGVR